MNGPILHKAPLLLHPAADAESGRMLFEHLQSFMLSRTKEMDRIHKTSNQMSDLRFMVFTKLIVVVRVTPRIMDMARTRITWAPALSARMS
jgi:flagellar assembly factor FliW